MRRLSKGMSVACGITILATFSSAAAGATATPPLPPAAGSSQVQAKPPTCRPEPQPDPNCRTGFRTDNVCYVGKRVVSRTIVGCTPPVKPKPPIATPQ